MTTATGYCRVTVVAPDSRIDVALPEDIPLADVYPEILRLSGQTQSPDDPTGFHLVRRDGTVLDAGLPLAAQRVLDGELLALRPFADSLAPAVYDDVVDAIASAVDRDRRRWSDDLMRVAGLVGGVLLLTMMGIALWFADPVGHDMHSLPGIVAGAAGVVLVALSGVRARVYDDRASALALGLAALPHLMLAGSGMLPADAGQGPGRLQFLVGCVTVLVASVLLIALTPGGDAPFVASAFASAVGTLATFGAIVTGASPSEVASVSAVAAVAFVAFLPGWSARFARLPIGFRSPEELARAEERGTDRRPDEEPVDYARITAQARRGHELLLGLVAGCSAVVVGSGAILGFSERFWAQLLALAVGTATLLRARLFRYTVQVACLLVSGIVAIALLILGLALNPPYEVLRAALQGTTTPAGDIRTLWLAGCIAAGAALLVAIALIVPRKGVSPFWGRVLDMGDAAVLLALVPLCLAVLDVYAAARGMTGS